MAYTPLSYLNVIYYLKYTQALSRTCCASTNEESSKQSALSALRHTRQRGSENYVVPAIDPPTATVIGFAVNSNVLCSFLSGFSILFVSPGSELLPVPRLTMVPPLDTGNASNEQVLLAKLTPHSPATR